MAPYGHRGACDGVRQLPAGGCIFEGCGYKWRNSDGNTRSEGMGGEGWRSRGMVACSNGRSRVPDILGLVSIASRRSSRHKRLMPVNT